MDSDSFLHEATLEAVVAADPVVLAKRRLQVILNLRTLAKELAPEDRKIKENMRPQVKGRVEKKHIALFRHLLEKLRYDDIGVVDLVANGIVLVGMQPAPKGYRPLVVPASMTQEELESSAWFQA